MATSPMPAQEGPTESPPSLPDGWLAQWEAQSRKYYYVQRATGHSQWEIPTRPALSVPTPDPTPQQTTDPFQQPPNQGLGGAGNANLKKDDGTLEDYQGADRSFLSDLAMNAVSGGKQSKPQKQSGLGGLASSILGGQGSHGGQGGGGLAGQLVGSLLGGGKPHNQNQSSHSGSGGSTSGAHDQGGLIGMASGFLGHHSSPSQSNNYGYSSSGQGSSSEYTGQAPPATYQPPGQQVSDQYGSQHNLHGQSHPQDTGSHAPNYSSSSNFGHGGSDSYGQSSDPHNNYAPHNQSGSQFPGAQGYPVSGGYNQQPNSFQGPPQGQYHSSTPNAPGYNQQSYPYPPNDHAYSGVNQQHQFHPPPPQNPSYMGQQGGNEPYQGGQNYGHSPQPSQSGYGPQGGYSGSGAPSAPGWR